MPYFLYPFVVLEKKSVFKTVYVLLVYSIVRQSVDTVFKIRLYIAKLFDFLKLIFFNVLNYLLNNFQSYLFNFFTKYSKLLLLRNVFN